MDLHERERERTQQQPTHEIQRILWPLGFISWQCDCHSLWNSWYHPLRFHDSSPYTHWQEYAESCAHFLVFFSGIIVSSKVTIYIYIHCKNAVFEVARKRTHGNWEVYPLLTIFTENTVISSSIRFWKLFSHIHRNPLLVYVPFSQLSHLCLTGARFNNTWKVLIQKVRA